MIKRINANELQQLLQQDEHEALDFKRKPHSVYADDKGLAGNSQCELVRDVVALANGNTTAVGKTAYLIFGAEDKKGVDGKRKLNDASDFFLSSERLLAWVNNKVAPRIPHVDCYPVRVENKTLFVIAIPPSEYIHITTTKLQTTDEKQYSPHTVFIRVKDRNESASREEENVLRRAKRRYFEHSSYVHPVWAIGLTALATALLIYSSLADKLVSEEMIRFLGPTWAQGLMVTIPTLLIGTTGFIAGKGIVDFKEIQIVWLRASRRKRMVMIGLGLVTLLYMVGTAYVITWLS